MFQQGDRHDRLVPKPAVVACNYTIDAGSPVTLSTTLSPATYYLWVDGAGVNSAGAYQLTADLP